jgi:hypothetical protein
MNVKKTVLHLLVEQVEKKRLEKRGKKHNQRQKEKKQNNPAAKIVSEAGQNFM